MTLTRVALVAWLLAGACQLSRANVTLSELSEAMQNTDNPHAKLVIDSMFNDYMTLMHAKLTSYTRGERVLPTGVDIRDIRNAAAASDLPDSIKNVIKQFESHHNATSGKNLKFRMRSGKARLQPALQVIVPDTIESLTQMKKRKLLNDSKKTNTSIT